MLMAYMHAIWPSGFDMIHGILGLATKLVQFSYHRKTKTINTFSNVTIGITEEF